MAERINQFIGRYRLLEELGSSEISSVYKAEDTQFKRVVALKLVTNSRGYSADFARYFLREALVLSQLSHPNIVKILDFGQDQGYLYVVMEYISGQTLERLLVSPVDWRQAAEWVIALADALQTAHSQNIIHRDLKPGNILLDADNQPMLTDFCIARIVEEEETHDYTGTNVGLGSPYYMSPEQGRGQPVDHRADIYSLGVLLFELVTGRRPFEAESRMEVVIQQVSVPPPDPRKFVSGLPEPIAKIILLALRKDPRERFQNMADFSAALEQVPQSGKYRPKARRALKPARLVTAVLSLAGLVLVAVLAAWQAGWLYPPLLPSSTPTPIPFIQVAGEPATAAPPVEPADVIAPSPNPTAAPTAASTSTPTQVPEYPLIEGFALPALAQEPISPSNVARLTELVRWGKPAVYSVIWGLEDNQLIAATSGGVFFYTSDSLRIERMLDAPGVTTALALDSVQRWLATGSQDGLVRVWSLDSRELVFVLSGHSLGKPISALAFSPDGKRLASASADQTARLWELSGDGAGAVVAKHSLPVNGVAFTSDGQHVLTCSDDFFIQVYDIEAGKQLARYKGSAQGLDLALSTDDRLLAVGLKNGLVELWDLTNGQQTPVRVVKEGQTGGAVRSLAFSRNNTLIVTGSADGTARIFSVSNGQLIRSMPVSGQSSAAGAFSDPVIKVAYSFSGTRLVSLTQTGQFSVWNPDQAEQIASKQLNSESIQRVVLSPDGKIAVIQAGTNRVFSWSLSAGKHLLDYSGKTIPSGQPFTSDSRTVALVDARTAVELFQIDSIIPFPSVRFTGFPSTGPAVAFLPGDKIFAAAGQRSLQLWSVTSGWELSQENSKYLPGSPCLWAYSTSGEFQAAGSTVGIFTNLETASILCTANRDVRVLDESYWQDSSYLAFGLNNGLAALWSGEDEIREKSFPAEKGKTLAVALSPDTGWLATAGTEKSVKIWDLKNLDQPLRVLAHHHAQVNDLAISHDGRLLITVSDDGMISIWGLLP
jgi:eukaryotic-like serine/threonine-protein kinase